MPDRIIRESICTSDTLNGLTDFEERFWHRLTVNCDDYGRFDARPAILKGRLFPLMDSKTQKNMNEALNKLASVGLIELYSVDGRPFLHVVTWDKYQRIRAKRSKFPEPDGTCCQLTADVPVIQSNPNPMRESESEDSAEAASGSPPVITLPLNDGTEYPVTVEQCQEWAGLYPAVDAIQQLREMRGWLLSNPTKRKTRRGILAFVTRWFGREQDKGGAKGAGLTYNPPAPAAPGEADRRAQADLERMRQYLADEKRREQEETQ